MNIFDASDRYEKWLGRIMPLVVKDIRYKHDRMTEAVFPFLRATFYRWMQHWDEACSEFAKHPQVLAVGDLHIENFGTWRDLDGRLIWGVNDFDEAFVLPYSIDLIRLGTSAVLAIDEQHFSISKSDAVDALLNGYELGLAEGGEPFVLEEHHRWLRKIAMSELREPSPFWQKMCDLEKASGTQRQAAKAVLHPVFRDISHKLPTALAQLEIRYLSRVAGLGSLGRPRIVGLTDCGGSWICREAKRMAPSAVLWARGHTSARSQHTGLILRKSVRVNDPFYEARGKWLVRRLAPHCSKIEVGHLPKKKDEVRLFQAMGFETANVHLGSGPGKAILRDLRHTKRRFFRRAIDRMADLINEDWETWRRGRL